MDGPPVPDQKPGDEWSDWHLSGGIAFIVHLTVKPASDKAAVSVQRVPDKRFDVA